MNDFIRRLHLAFALRVDRRDVGFWLGVSKDARLKHAISTSARTGKPHYYVGGSGLSWTCLRVEGE